MFTSLGDKFKEIGEYWDRENQYIKDSGIYTPEEVEQILANHEEIRRNQREEASKKFNEEVQRYRDELSRHSWYGRQLCLAVFLHHLAQLEVLVGCAAVFVYRGIIVVACHVGGKTGRVGSCPMAEACSSVGHIQRKADVFR